MKRVFLGLGLAVLTIACVGCDKDSSPTGSGGTTTPADVPDDIALARTFPPLLANGMDQIPVYATVVNASGRALADVGVSFSTTHGTIERYATTNANGVAQTTLTSAASVSDISARVTARASADTSGGLYAMSARVVLTKEPVAPERLFQTDAAASGSGPMLRLPLATEVIDDQATVMMTGVTLTVSADPEVLPADGVSESRIVAALMETTRRVPISGEELHFGADAGLIAGQVTTGDDGLAASTLTASPGDEAAWVRVYYGPGLADSVQVHFSPLTLALTADPGALLADGVSQAQVTAQLSTDQGNPVAGAAIDFSTTAGIIPGRVVTDASGQAVALLTAADSPGTANITASFAGTLSENLAIPFAPLPETERLLLAANPASLAADGMSQATVTVTALDENDNPVPDGTIVELRVAGGSGTLIAPVGVTQAGVYEATYVAGTAAGAVTIEAVSGSVTETLLITLEYLHVGGLTLGAQPTSILANGIATSLITAHLSDAYGNPVLPGTVVSFITSAGELDQITPADANGTATARLRSEPQVTGTARVTATAGGFQKTVDVKFTSSVGTHIEAIAVEPPAIGVLGAGDDETAVVTFKVVDAYGIPVDLDHPATVAFSIVPQTGETDATLSPLTAVTNDRGEVQVTLSSGEESGAVLIHATYATVTAEPIRVAIHGGLPVEEHFSFAFEHVNVAGLVYAGIHNGVTAYVGDHHGNPVPMGTRVWFNADYGVIQGSAGTNEFGEATVTHVSAAPVPANGFVPVCAQTIDSDGEWMEVCGEVLWSGQTQIQLYSPEDDFVVENGGGVVISFFVGDYLGHPLVEGTTISVTASAGALGGDTQTVLPDTQSPAYTFFEAVLTDADIETNEPQTVTITINVTSQNGNLSTFVTGTIY
jgi:hypothetical protein